jgi:hypothetical protein
MLHSGVSYGLTDNVRVTNTCNYTKWRLAGDLSTLQESSRCNNFGGLQLPVVRAFASQRTGLESFHNILDFSAYAGKKLFPHANWKLSRFNWRERLASRVAMTENDSVEASVTLTRNGYRPGPDLPERGVHEILLRRYPDLPQPCANGPGADGLKIRGTACLL